jgi:uncharacterized integral membrane protein (TIGR00698 family)
MMQWPNRWRAIAPGLALSAAVAILAVFVGRAERAYFGAEWLEPLVLAILIGAVIRTMWQPPAQFAAGIKFSAKTVLEISIVLLGASVSAQTLLSVGPGLLIGTVALVAIAVPGAFLLGRMMGLHWRMALLIACGNGICGNSAIAAVAPVIDADSDDVSASIAFTAVLGVAVVLGLPLIGHMAGLGAVEYGMLSGMTVYAVPQVLAAAAPMGASAIQIGTLVKLVRVVMLGPVTVVVSMLANKLTQSEQSGTGRRSAGLSLMPPLFILGFLMMSALRSADVIPEVVLHPMAATASTMTVISMAALGLGVDARGVLASGPRVIATVILSLVLLIGIALGLIALL